MCVYQIIVNTVFTFQQNAEIILICGTRWKCAKTTSAMFNERHPMELVAKEADSVSYKRNKTVRKSVKVNKVNHTKFKLFNSF